MPRPLPADPLVRNLIVQARNSQVSRRSVLAGASLAAAGLSLAACSSSSTAAKPTAAVDGSASDKKLVWANWPGYLDLDDSKQSPTLNAFQKQSGLTVKYDVAIDDNNTYYGKVKDQLRLGQDIGADVVCLTDWMIGRLIRFGYVQKLDESKIPNKKNVTPALQNPDFDPGRKLSLPWQGGFAGICWNKEKIPGGLKSVSDLWDPKYKGRIGVLSEMRDTIGLIMLENGVDLAGKWNDDAFMNATDDFKKHVVSGQIRNVKGNAYLQDLKSEDTIAAICWSGDITTLNGEAGDKWEFAIPSAGATLWNDNYVVPIGSKRKSNAEAIMNYYYEPEVAAEVAAYVNYITPVVGAQAVAAEKYPELANNQLIFPNAETLSKAHIFRTLSAAEESKYSAAFQAVLLGS